MYSVRCRISGKKPQARKESSLSGSSRTAASAPSGWSVGTRTEPAGKVSRRRSRVHAGDLEAVMALEGLGGRLGADQAQHLDLDRARRGEGLHADAVGAQALDHLGLGRRDPVGAGRRQRDAGRRAEDRDRDRVGRRRPASAPRRGPRRRSGRFRSSEAWNSISPAGVVAGVAPRRDGGRPQRAVLGRWRPSARRRRGPAPSATPRAGRRSPARAAGRASANGSRPAPVGVRTRSP